MKEVIKIGIAEDHKVFLQVFMQSFEDIEDIEVAFGVTNGLELLKELDDHQVDIVLLDLNMPVMDGGAALEQMRKEHPDVRVIILSHHYSDYHVRKYIKMGARGYLCKEDVDLDTVLDAIHDVYYQGYFFHDKVSRNLLAELIEENAIDPSFPKNEEPLTGREKDIITLICQEKTNTEIADSLSISIRTVQNHRLSIKKKTGARNVVGVTLYALKHGLYVIQ